MLAEHLALLDYSLPDRLREVIEPLSRHQDLTRRTRELAHRDGSAAELRQVREQLAGNEAADRLEALDQQRAQWQQRVGGWLQERDAILSQHPLASQERDDWLERARRDRFSDTEQRRIAALERMHDQRQEQP